MENKIRKTLACLIFILGYGVLNTFIGFEKTVLIALVVIYMKND